MSLPMNDSYYFASSIQIREFKKMVSDVIKDELKGILEQLTKELRDQLIKEDEKPMSIAELAAHFKVTKVTIHNWRNRGLIEGVKVGRKRYFLKSELNEVLGRYGYERYVK